MFAIRLTGFDYKDYPFGKTLFVSNDRNKIEQKYKELLEPFYRVKTRQIELESLEQLTDNDWREYKELLNWYDSDKIFPEYLFIDEVEEI